jgi:hypothetical protein
VQVQRETGRKAQMSNIAAGKAVSEIIRTTLGPRSMLKMLLDPMGGIVMTNDGNSILREVDVSHPAAKSMIELSRAQVRLCPEPHAARGRPPAAGTEPRHNPTPPNLPLPLPTPFVPPRPVLSQDEQVGDGTTSVIVLAGEYLNLAGPLLERQMHPTTICNGYLKALDDAIKVGGRRSTLNTAGPLPLPERKAHRPFSSASIDPSDREAVSPFAFTASTAASCCIHGIHGRFMLRQHVDAQRAACGRPLAMLYTPISRNITPLPSP